MDSTSACNRIRSLIDRLRTASDKHNDPNVPINANTAWDIMCDVSELADAWSGLDESLRRGGSLPDAWSNPYRS